MIRKFKKETSKRKKYSYKDLKLNVKNSFLMRQSFNLSYTYVYKKKRIFGYSDEDYKKFKANPSKFGVNSNEEYTLISPKYKRKNFEKRTEDLEIEKKYYKKKILYCGKITFPESDSIRLGSIENALFRLSC